MNALKYKTDAQIQDDARLMAGLNTSFTGVILFRNCEENIRKHEANAASQINQVATCCFYSSLQVSKDKCQLIYSFTLQSSAAVWTENSSLPRPCIWGFTLTIDQSMAYTDYFFVTTDIISTPPALGWDIWIQGIIQ